MIARIPAREVRHYAALSVHPAVVRLISDSGVASVSSGVVRVENDIASLSYDVHASFDSSAWTGRHGD
jgi:hypothetical protein